MTLQQAHASDYGLDAVPREQTLTTTLQANKLIHNNTICPQTLLMLPLLSAMWSDM